MVRVQYGSGQSQLPAPTIAVVAGSTTQSYTGFVAIQGVNGSGANKASDPIAFNVSAAQALQITLPTKLAAESFTHYRVLLGNSNTIAQLVQVAVIRSSATSVILTQDAHFAPAPVVNVLPTGADLLDGMCRSLASGTYTYSAIDQRPVSDLDILNATPTGRWLRILSASRPVVDTLSAGGCDFALDATTIQDLDLVANYSPDSGASTPITYWIVNDSTPASGVIVPQGTPVTLRAYLDDVPASQLLSELITYNFAGIVNLADYSIDTSYLTVGQYTYKYGELPLALPIDLQPNHAVVLAISIRLPAFSLSRSVKPGSTIYVEPEFRSQAGSYSAIAQMFGDVVFTTGQSRRIVPGLGLSAIALSGSVAIKGVVSTLVGNQLVTGLRVNEANQRVLIDGNANVAVEPANGFVPGTYRLRAMVGTISGRSRVSAYSPAISTATTGGLRFNLIQPILNTGAAIIRSDYPDVIAGMAAGLLNASQVDLYVLQISSGQIRQFVRPILPEVNYQIDIGSWTSGAIVPNLPTSPATNFGLFDVTASIVSGTPGGDFPAGGYQVAVCYLYDGNQITSISHDPQLGCLKEFPSGWFEHFLDFNDPHHYTPRTFTGVPSTITPDRPNQLLIKTDANPNQLFRSTGSNQGALTPVGTAASTTSAPYQILPVSDSTALRAIDPATVQDFAWRFLVSAPRTQAYFDPDSTAVDDGLAAWKPNLIAPSNPGRWIAYTATDTPIEDDMPNYEIKTTSFTAVAGHCYLLDNSNNLISVTTPQNPTIGQWFYLATPNDANTYNITVDGLFPNGGWQREFKMVYVGSGYPGATVSGWQAYPSAIVVSGWNN